MCLWLSFYEPHSPFNFPIKFASQYSPSDIDLPETSSEDGRWVPAIFRDFGEADRRGIVASYYNSAEYVDSDVGRMLDALAELGLSKSTLVVYISEHGYLLGNHGRFEKHMMWEEIVTAWPADLASQPSVPIEWQDSVHRGGCPVPSVELSRGDARTLWFDEHLRTYIERDLQTMAAIGNLVAWSVPTPVEMKR